MDLTGQTTAWLSSPKTAISTAAATTSTGLGTMWDWIPADIGSVAALAGFLLTCLLAYINWRKWELDQIKIQLEIDALKRAAEKTQR